MNLRLPILLALSLSACTSISKTDSGKVGSSSPDQSLRRSKEVIPLSGTFKVNRFSFENGLRLLVVEDHSSPTFAYQTWFRVGSRDEIKGKTGLAHLFEHMMFKETKNLKDGEFDKLLEQAGVEGENAFTSWDYTAYVQELPKDKLDLIARLEADRMTNLVINDASFKTEREVVQNERRYRNENSPDGTMDQELFSLAFTKHPYHWPIIGYEKDLAEMTSQDAAKFYQSYYSPNHATIIVVGDVEPEKVRSVVEKYYAALPSQILPKHPIPTDPPQSKPRHKQLKLNIQVEKILLGYRIPEVHHPDSPALDVLESVLTGGKSSRLHKALVESGIASGVDSYTTDNKDPSLFIFAVNLQKNRKASEAEAALLKEVALLATHPISAEELERAKNKIEFEYYQQLGSNSRRAHFLGHYESATGDFVNGINRQEKIKAITAADIQKVAKLYLDSKSRTVVTGVQK